MKTLTGTVINIVDAQTAVVLTERMWQHPTYGKSVRRTKKYTVHVEGLTVNIGDEIVIGECKPVSKTKRFKVIEVIEKQ